MVKEYIMKYYMDVFKKALKNKEMSIDELAQKTGLPRGTIVRWSDILTVAGFLKQRKEGRKLLISLNE